MKLWLNSYGAVLVAMLSSITAGADNQSHFECKEMGRNQYRPYYVRQNADGSFTDYSTQPKGLLGQNPMPSLDECRDALDAANPEFGVICSRTGLDGWKPTLYTGTRPGRADYGYLGGSSIMRFKDCLLATRKSSRKGVCYWGGSEWFISRIDREQNIGGPFRTVEECVLKTAP